MDERKSGILLHISSLPSRFGIGDLGPDAYTFVDFLSETHQSFWQILPLNPTNSVHANSPYSSPSAFAANTLLISPEFLCKEELLKDSEIANPPEFNPEQLNYDEVRCYKLPLFKVAYKRFKESGRDHEKFIQFLIDQHDWINDFALFTVIKEIQGGKVWSDWPKELKHRDEDALKQIEAENQDRIGEIKFLQFIFLKQWQALKSYCHEKGVQIIGDIPIYVDFDSVDVWTHPEIFKLNKLMKPEFVSGVPPDYFSKTGQRWGNPVYDWEKIHECNFDWWIKRVKHNMNLLDVVRIDHFRGLVAYWEIPAKEKTAVNGYWVDVPTNELFTALKASCPNLNVIAEDLGIITDDVIEAMKQHDLPGMKILMFAFGDDLEKHPYLPHNYEENCVVYTGTHDNNTARGWYHKDATDAEKTNLAEYLKKDVSPDTIHQDLIELALNSKSNLAIIPLQDILGLDEEARMNTPATKEGNWMWRYLPEQLNSCVRGHLQGLTTRFSRK